jgi:hypothetical protein
MRPINISSNTRGLGGALTNPTCLAKRKGNLAGDYPVRFRGSCYPDAEAAFHAHTQGLPFEAQQVVSAQIVEAKLRQHPRLVAAIRAEGGIAWLEQCVHRTGARTASFARWEGEGRGSAYLRTLIRAYEAVTAGMPG